MSAWEWAARVLTGLVSLVLAIIVGDWMQTRVLNARRRLREADDRVVDEIAAPATRVYLSASAACSDLGWQVYATDDLQYTLWAINRTPHLGLRNLGLILHMTAFGSGETRVSVALNSPHPAWVRRSFHTAVPRLLDRLRLRVLDAETAP